MITIYFLTFICFESAKVCADLEVPSPVVSEFLSYSVGLDECTGSVWAIRARWWREVVRNIHLESRHIKTDIPFCIVQCGDRGGYQDSQCGHNQNCQARSYPRQHDTRVCPFPTLALFACKPSANLIFPPANSSQCPKYFLRATKSHTPSTPTFSSKFKRTAPWRPPPSSNKHAPS